MEPRHRLTAALAGQYEIVREIGAGGMAVVYLARDVRHNRSVALKVLNPELAAVLGVERFLAEIQVTANLQHPNLLPLFDSGEADGMLFYVMPYVEGESLRARLEREKQLPVDEAVRIATAIAATLDYAHRRRVIHRDLKPENILLQDGQPLIADFGIALAVSNAGGARITQTGLSLGTPQYMSPEQATGDRAVDGRTDIYSLGAITYEMLVGDPPHHAGTVQAIIAKVLTEKPPSVRLSRPNVPESVDAAVMRALEKLAADRFGTANEFAAALKAHGVATSGVAAPVAHFPRALGAREAAAWALAGALAIAAAWEWRRAAIPAEAPVIRARLDLAADVHVDETMAGSSLAISPRGDVIAYTARAGQPFTAIRRTDALNARIIAGPNGLPIIGRNLTFSPDGRFLAFTEGNQVYKVAVDAAQATEVGTRTGGNAAPYGLTWGVNDTLYLGSFLGMSALPASGGPTRPIGTRDSVSILSGARWPLLLPDRRTLLFIAGRSASDLGRLGKLDLKTESTTIFDFPAAMILGIIQGQLVYVAPEGRILAVKFDDGSKRPVGDPIPLEEGVVLDPTTGAKISLSASGTLLYLKGRADYQLVIAGRNAAVPTPLFNQLRVFQNPRLSPDAKKVAVTVTGTGSPNIWIYDLGSNTFTQLTTEGSNARPEWSPDGKRVLYRSERAGKIGIWWQAADGSSPAELLYEPPYEPFEAVISPDSAWLVFRTAPGREYSRDVLAVPMRGERKILPLATGPATESMPRISPDGKWLAYQGSESGSFQVYVRPFPGAGAKTQVSVDGGWEPVWGRDGRELVYRDRQGAFISARVTTGDRFSIVDRRRVAIDDYLTDASHAGYDLFPDGRLLVLKRAGAESQTIIVHNWAREVREKTGQVRQP